MPDDDEGDPDEGGAGAPTCDACAGRCPFGACIWEGTASCEVISTRYEMPEGPCRRYSHCEGQLDLDGGTDDLYWESDGSDASIEVVPGASVAVLEGEALDSVTHADIEHASFSDLGGRFTVDRVILIRTALGNVFGLGNPALASGEQPLLAFDAALATSP